MLSLLRSIFVDQICYVLNKRIFRLLKVKRYQFLLKHSIVHGNIRVKNCCFTYLIFLWSFLQTQIFQNVSKHSKQAFKTLLLKTLTSVRIIERCLIFKKVFLQNTKILVKIARENSCKSNKHIEKILIYQTSTNNI